VKERLSEAETYI